MALFNGKDGDRFSPEQTLTLIGAEAHFHGVLNVKGSIRIEGTVEGDITDAAAVEIGKAGKVKGNISAETLSVAGEVTGDVVVSRNLELLTSGKIHGKVRTPRIRIEDGATFNGECAMSDAPRKSSEERHARTSGPVALKA
jgi:cytoskeletal protein CcmA (bactofilin family)